MDIGCLAGANHWTAIIAICWLGNSILEFWLGRTEKTKASSTLEAILMMFAAIATYFITRRKDNGSSTKNDGST